MIKGSFHQFLYVLAPEMHENNWRLTQLVTKNIIIYGNPNTILYFLN